MAKSVDGDSAFASTSRFDAKRSPQWFLDADAPELFPNKKQSVLTLNSTSSLGLSDANAPSWDNASGYQPVPNPFINRLFESETRSFSFEERNASSVENVSLSASLGLPVSHGLEDPEAFLDYGGFRKVKVNQIKEPDNSVHALNGQSFATQSGNEISTIQGFDRETGHSFMNIGQGYNQEVNTVTLTGHIFDGGDTHAVPTCSTYIKEDLNASQLDECPTKEATHMISFTGFHGEHNRMPVSRSTNSYDQTYLEDKVSENELGASNASAVVGITQAVKSKSVSASKNKSESKGTKKEAPNSFPSNVRSLISTGMLDGVPVKYVSVSREELRGTIKGSGYLCGCQSCNHSKVLNAYEFERHAGCKTKHPNSHIYFENGKTIYQIVQELRSTPESMLFDVIQNVFGAPINQKAFRTWKESYQAATRELQRIYGKEELNL